MPSAIDATKPVQGNPTTESVRENFAAAKSEIEVLQLTAGVGPQGPIGPIGPAGTIGIGTVTTGPAGGNATVTNSGSPQAAVLNFTLPRGDAGAGGGGITETQAVDAVRRGQVRFEEAAVTTAAGWPTTPNLAGAPVLGSGWSLVSGSGATGVYTQVPHDWGYLSYPATFVAGDWYQVVYIATRTSPLPEWGDGELYFQLGNSADSASHGVGPSLKIGVGTQIIVFQAPAGATHLIVSRDFDQWVGNFTLTRVVRHPGPQNSQVFNIKDFRVVVRGNNNFYEGTEIGRWNTGSHNIVIGVNAGVNLTNANNNTAIGSHTLQHGITASGSAVLGYHCMREATGGSWNTCVGSYSLVKFSSGMFNVALGTHALNDLNIGNRNTALGLQAAYGLLIGDDNVALGSYSEYERPDGDMLLTANSSTFVGNYASAADNGQANQTALGYYARGHGSNTITLGNDDVTSLHCNVQAISALSDSRVKENVQPANLDLCLQAVKNLPVSRWGWQPIAGAHPDKHVTGFMADDLAKIFPKSVTKETRYLPVRDASGNVQMVAAPVKPPSKAPRPKMDTPEEPTPAETTPHQILKTQKFDDLQYVQPTELLPTLWGAVQRLVQKCEELEKRLAEAGSNPSPPVEPKKPEPKPEPKPDPPKRRGGG